MSYMTFLFINYKILPALTLRGDLPRLKVNLCFNPGNRLYTKFYSFVFASNKHHNLKIVVGSRIYNMNYSNIFVTNTKYKKEKYL